MLDVKLPHSFGSALSTMVATSLSNMISLKPWTCFYFEHSHKVWGYFFLFSYLHIVELEILLFVVLQLNPLHDQWIHFLWGSNISSSSMQENFNDQTNLLLSLQNEVILIDKYRYEDTYFSSEDTLRWWNLQLYTFLILIMM